MDAHGPAPSQCARSPAVSESRTDLACKLPTPAAAPNTPARHGSASAPWPPSAASGKTLGGVFDRAAEIGIGGAHEGVAADLVITGDLAARRLAIRRALRSLPRQIWPRGILNEIP